MTRTIAVSASKTAKAHTREIADAVAAVTTDCEVSLGSLANASVDALVARPHVSDSPAIYNVDFPDFGDDERAEVRDGLESGENDRERSALVSVAQGLGITWNDPYDEDEEEVDRSAEPQNATAAMIRKALEDDDEEPVRDALGFLADEYEISYTDPDDVDEDDDDRLCGCGARHAVHVDEVEEEEDDDEEAGWYYDESGYQRDTDGVLTAAGRAKWITDDEAIEDDDDEDEVESSISDSTGGVTLDPDELCDLNDQLTAHLSNHGWSAVSAEDDNALDNLTHDIAKQKALVGGLATDNRSAINAIVKSFITEHAEQE